MRSAQTIVCFFLAVLVSGCVPQSKETLPQEFACHNPEIVGVYSDGDSDSDVKNRRVTIKDETKGIYLLQSPNEAPTEFQLFKLNELYIAATKLGEPEKLNEADRYVFYRVKFEPTQITVTPLSEQWFRENLDKLPGTEECPADEAQGKRIELTAAPQLLRGFFLLVNDPSLWNDKAAKVYKKAP